MSEFKIAILAALFLSLYSSCAPVKFSKSEVSNLSSVCEGTGCTTGAVMCDPKINQNLTTFTYPSSVSNYPSISAQCSPSGVQFIWSIKKPDASNVTTSISELTGANPSQVNLTILGEGVYYVYLTARDQNGKLKDYNSARPLEFVVPGNSVGNSLTCDPKLNTTFNNVTIGASDNNPVVSANCVPSAATYTWTVKKNGGNFAVLGLSGSSSAPDFKYYGAGTYTISLYATLTGSTHWQSSSPLTVTVQNPPPEILRLECNPRINGSLSELNLTSAAANPLISANCLPLADQYTWRVTKNGSQVSVSGLNGANANPNFASLGVGTYLIYLTAEASGYSDWQTTTPLKITVESVSSTLTLNCSPRLNGTSTAVTTTVNGTNPQLTSGCNPASAVHTWVVTKNGAPVTVAGVSGASSTPNFIASGKGTYFVSLTATASGYNSYVSPSSLEVTVADEPSMVREVTFEKTVQASENKVDILMVVDDSNSMAAENNKLAKGLQGFVSDLTSSGLDWQMCATVTRSQDVNNNGSFYWGASRNWIGYIGSYNWVLKHGATDPYAIFTNTMTAIGAGWEGSDDERGIKAAWWSFEYQSYNKCYRADASLAVILISDEDERSIGGDSSLVYYDNEFKPLEAQDQPQELINKVKLAFGDNKRFTFNSIIVKPGDTNCLKAQDEGGSKAHYGYKYYELSNLTNGAATSICDADYSNSLKYFKDRIINSLSSQTLECAPVGDISVAVTPTMTNLTTRLENNQIVFTPPVPVGRTVKLNYNCARN